MGIGMCLAIPAQVISTDGENATVDVGGVQKTIGLMLTPNVKVGDYVLLHAGFSIGIVDADEARETLALFKELAEVSEIR
jgi:hydrogenase expression/formation protein HypC